MWDRSRNLVILNGIATAGSSTTHSEIRWRITNSTTTRYGKSVNIGGRSTFNHFLHSLSWKKTPSKPTNPTPAFSIFSGWGQSVRTVDQQPLHLFDGEHFRELFTRTQLNNDNVVAVLPLGEEKLLVTEKNGIFHLGGDLQSLQPWPTTADKRLRREWSTEQP